MHVDKKPLLSNFHQNLQRPWPSISRSKIRIEYIGRCIREKRSVCRTWLRQKVRTISISTMSRVSGGTVDYIKICQVVFLSEMKCFSFSPIAFFRVYARVCVCVCVCMCICIRPCHCLICGPHKNGSASCTPLKGHPRRIRRCSSCSWPTFYWQWISHKWWQIGHTLQLQTHRKWLVAFRLAYLHLTLAHSKCEGQGHAHFHCEYLANDDS